MTSRGKVLEAEKQVQQIMNGVRDALECPFCGLVSTPENRLLCCEPMAEMAGAVMDHVDHIYRVDLVNRMLDRMEKAQSAVLN